MPKSAHDQRRLDGTYEVTSGCCSLSTERERVRTSAALNWHLYPPGEAYDDVYDEVLGEAAWDRQDIWDQGQGIYGFGWESSQTPTEQAEAYEVYLRAQQEIFANYLLSDVDTSSWDPRHEPMSRYGEGTQDATGVALGVYEAADGTQMLVFRGSYSHGDFDNILKWMKDWILEKAGDSVIQAWEGIGETFTDEMKSRKGGDLQSRCGMRAGTTLFTNMHNGDLAESVEGVSASDIKKYGYWPITKLMVRSLLPADRDQNLDPTIYISGHSQGGARASLVSMWLEKEDGVAYKTYSLSPLGVQCMSRQLAFLPGSSNGHDYLDDVDPYIRHDQITSYLHPLDIYALNDYQPGKVCQYGNSRFYDEDGTRGSESGGADLLDRFERIVGYSGALLYVDMFTQTPSRIFGQTRFWTHSISWMNVLFSETEFLDEDGETDGGCVWAEIVPESDPDNMCPEGDSDMACNALYIGLPLAIFLVVIIFPTLCCCYFFHCCCFKKHKDGKTHFEKTVVERMQTKKLGAQIAAEN
ncbi:hypothetical protein TeGR_g11085 [Tetraparma gracilis]|uniref:Fungal lipase-like domain-containing protein n=1 Tax=Tetraparma gracilis TaxID=2962635 RepID=A0ABQ6N3I9_9STRA|nr:hypothetical protein TeGR_g11085 [Tetraparma gracilis]